MVAFHGIDASDYQGIYLWIDGELRVVADFDTPIPESTCNFGWFGGMDFDDGLLVFRGRFAIPLICFDPSGQSGVYGYSVATGELFVIANTNTPVPGLEIDFNGFKLVPTVQSGTAIFTGNWADPQVGQHVEGVFRYVAGSLDVAVGRDVLNPTTGEPFGGFEPPVSLSGNDMAFIWKDVFAILDGEVHVLAELGTPVPDRTTTFTLFDASSAQLTDNGIVFMASDDQFVSPSGVYVYQDGVLARIADDQTIFPGIDRTLSRFNNMSGDGHSVVFRGRGPESLFAVIDGQLVHVIDHTFDLGCARSILFLTWPDIDGRQVSFVPVCHDRTEAVYIATIESICGDGVIESSEQCDDGNTDAGDGCSPDCQSEGDPGGCSPGFWKQPHHLAFWSGYSTDDLFDDVFGVEAFASRVTLLNALWRKGGKEYALGRQAVAALLNAARRDVVFVYTVDQVIALVQGAFASANFNDVKDQLELENVRGCTVQKSVQAEMMDGFELLGYRPRRR